MGQNETTDEEYLTKPWGVIIDNQLENKRWKTWRNSVNEFATKKIYY